VPEPKWRQIAEDLRQKIESGELGGYDDGKPRPLPTELELQDEYGASRNTVRDAIDWLRTRRLVYTRSGQGTFVAQKINPYVTRLATNLAEAQEGSAGDSKQFKSDVEALGRQPEIAHPQVEILLATALRAAELGLDEGASLVSRHQRRLIDGVPHSLQTSYYPMALVERGATQLIRAQDIGDGAVAYIGKVLGMRQAGWRDRIRVRTPDDAETAFFGLPDDGSVAVVEITRTSYDEHRNPFRVTVTTYPADRNQFEMFVGIVAD
jgi:GntR family transcriptional regulator